MNLARFARRRYADGPTPLQPMARFSAELGGPNLYIKRDDLLGFASGGNKVRKLEFVVAEALSQGADYLVTCGAVQSNHCRLTLAAAVREGLGCGLVLEERVPGSYKPRGSGNNFLYRLMGVDRLSVVPGGSDMPAAMQAMAAEVKAAGRRPYLIPGGASSPLGALGYAACAQEISGQAFEAGLRIDRVVCASGSAGTHAGLLAGFWAMRSGVPVVGINVSRPKELQEEFVFRLLGQTLSLAGVADPPPREAVLCFADYVGPGYSLPTPEMVAAVKLLARTEAVLLDPVYTGKAMAGLIDLCRKGFFAAGENVLFVHTGGSPALYAYTDSFWE
jgi:D-cysteine desulfhydrase